MSNSLYDNPDFFQAYVQMSRGQLGLPGRENGISSKNYSQI